jgi:hypothetical protein
MRKFVLILIIALAFFACDDKDETHTHEWEWKVTTPATPTADGLETETCKTCGETSGNIRIIHDWGNWRITTFPTETATGVETRICTIDQTHIDTRPLTLATFQTYFYGKWVQDNDSAGYPVKDVNSYLIINADLFEINRTVLNVTANIRVWTVTENNYSYPDYAVDYPSGYGLESTIATHSNNPEEVGSEGTFPIFINVDKNRLYFRNGNHPTYVRE